MWKQISPPFDSYINERHTKVLTLSVHYTNEEMLSNDVAKILSEDDDKNEHTVAGFDNMIDVITVSWRHQYIYIAIRHS